MAAVTPSSRPSLLVKLRAHADLSDEQLMPRGPERKRAVYEDLVETARTSQQPLVELAESLRERGIIAGYETLISPNMLVVKPAQSHELSARVAFSRRDDVEAIFENQYGSQVYPVGVYRPPPPGSSAEPPAAPSDPWGPDPERPAPLDELPPGPTPALQLIGAPEAWRQGATGAGLVFGSIDSGVDSTHPALRDSYRGAQPDGSQQHDYSWMDFTREPSGVPIDASGHGTHTLGSVVGATDAGQTGAAPGATWIAARAAGGTGGRGAVAQLRALEWMQAPTRLDGSAPDPSRAPDVIGMSWWLGRSDEHLLREAVANLSSAGIELVKSAGNRGPQPYSMTSPSQYAEVTAVASVDESGTVARSSSRGPSLVPVPGAPPKPDVAAPGAKVLSSVPGGQYAVHSGTSMAQPHVSGAILDVLGAYPQLTHAQVQQALAEGAVDRGAPGHDPDYGHGIVNIPGALEAARRIVAGGVPATNAVAGAALLTPR